MPEHSSGYQDQAFVAEYYDVLYERLSRPDIGFFIEYAQKAPGRTLELGCGTGRVLIPTAQTGCYISGLDISPYMLAKCRQKLSQQSPEVQSRVKLVQGDMTEFSLGEEFALITIPFRPFQHLITVPEQKACLTCVRKHLKHDGLFILDVYHPFIPRLIDARYLMEIETGPTLELPDGGTLRRTARTAAFHPIEQYNDIELIHYVKHPDGREERLVHAFPMRYFHRYELEHLLELCGFRVVDIFGNYDRSPFVDDSPEMIIVAKKFWKR